ncbi:MAG TPA: ComF family protein [Geobacteraceae bacterium]|nr:ComF family protein [Geobacteraceae bacterium]
MLKAFLDIIFPPRCHFCKVYIAYAGDIHLCNKCMEACRLIASPLCNRCGIPFVTDAGEDHLCGACIDRPPRFTAARAAALFEGPVRELVHRLKYKGRVQLRRPLGLLAVRQLAPFAADSSADLIIPVPLHVKRLRQRGFNQAILLGEILAREWRLPLMRRNLRRTRWTEPQINLSAAERIANVRGAFSVSKPELVRDKKVLLVDDVYTTGSTVSECTKVLLRAGAEEVFIVTIARALQ